ncbi:MAG: radical SAM protein [Euryarchaeota archaeon]|nr:radical SAM protein [Euryarchaeota archaeon]
MYDPLKLSEEIEKKVASKINGKIYRKYYRFRPARFYSGCSSADTCGCNLRCVFCWSNDLAREGEIGKYYSPEEVAGSLIKIAEKFGFKQIRITGNEPTISKKHLIQVLGNIPLKYTFILETNGILLGSDEEFVEELKKFDNLHVRVSLKGCNEDEFTKLTNASPEAFNLQLLSIKKLLNENIACHPAVMVSFSEKENLEQLRNCLHQIDPKLAKTLELEELILYPHVARRLKAARIRYYTSYAPSAVPQEQI